MYEAVRPYGSKGLPFAQEDDGRLKISGIPSGGGESENVNVTVQIDNRPVIFPSPANISTVDAINSSGRGHFETPDGVKIRATYMGNLGDSVEIVGRSVAAGTNSGIYRSIDNGETWTRLSDSAEMPTGRVYATGRTVLNVIQGQSGKWTEVWVSSTFDSHASSNWTKVIDIASGEFSDAYGLSIRDNVVLMTSYGDKDAANPPRHLYISRDFGLSFTEVEVRKIADMPDPTTFHTHDCEYDPYANRIWVSNGDQSNSAVQYSDDWGATWHVINTAELAYSMQPTNIVALPDRILFCTDDKPDGVKVWRRDLKNPKARVDPKDVELLYTPDASFDQGNLFHVANNSRTRTDSQIDTYPFNLFLVFNQAGGHGVVRLVASPDGEQFYTLVSLEGRDALAGHVLGPCSNDPEKRVFFNWYDRGDGNNYFIEFRYPKWVVMK